jgi:phosphatidylserine decarboxylase
MVRDGYFYGVGCLAAAALLLWLTSWPLALIPVLLAAFFLWFFRNPSRVIPAGDGLIVSPGDGLVTETIRLETPQGPVQRISIFLSVFDVHVNRTPIAGTITSVRYQKGKYLNAMNPASADQNEQNIVTVRAAEGYEVTFKQIAGLIARRIVFDPQVGQVIGRGELVGLIKFGSRVDVILPIEAELRVKKGVRVKGGASVLAAMPAASSTGVRL